MTKKTSARCSPEVRARVVRGRGSFGGTVAPAGSAGDSTALLGALAGLNFVDCPRTVSPSFMPGFCHSSTAAFVTRNS